MSILRVRHSALGDTDRIGDQRLEPPPNTIQLRQDATKFARRQPLQVGNLRQLDRTHVLIMANGCYTVVHGPRRQARMDPSPSSTKR